MHKSEEYGTILLKQKDKQNTKQNVISNSNASNSSYSDSFEEAWKLYSRQGSKKKSYTYWKLIPEGDHQHIIEAIPKYLKCIIAGRMKSDFEGWINPANEKWANDWDAVLLELTKKVGTQNQSLINTHHAKVRDESMHNQGF